jgi:hypothetical protein
MNTFGITPVTPSELNKLLLALITAEFPKVKFNEVPTRNRTSPYIPNAHRDNRWMQIDVQSDSLSVVMDHVRGDIDEDDLLTLGLPLGLGPKNSGIQLNANRDHVKLTVYADEPYDFQRPEFVSFLHKHYASYIRRVEVY